MVGGMCSLLPCGTGICHYAVISLSFKKIDCPFLFFKYFLFDMVWIN